MKKKIWKFIEKNHMIEEKDKVIVGVSGGPDSMALLDVLLALRERRHFQVAVVHVNHNIRGAEAVRDQNFVEEYCCEHQIPCRIFSYNILQIAHEEKITTEEAGRNARQKAFRQYMAEWQGTKIALAHHQNDLAETMLFHLARGTGLAGLAGIAPVNGDIIRPFLCIERVEIEQYLNEHQIPFVIDSTNDELDYTRNKIRHELISYMVREINPRTISHMADTASLVRQSEEYLISESKKACNRHCYVYGEDGMMILSSMLEEAPIIQTYMLREILMQCCATAKDISSANINGIQDLFYHQTGKKIALPYEMEALHTYEGVVIRRKRKGLEKESPEVLLTVPGWTRWEQNGFVTGIYPFSGQEILAKTYTKCLNYDRIENSLTIRQRRPGDYIIVNKEGGKKKLKDYMIDCKIPQEKRDGIPVLAMGSEILWVVGYRISEYYKITKETQKVLEITYQGGDKNE